MIEIITATILIAILVIPLPMMWASFHQLATTRNLALVPEIRTRLAGKQFNQLATQVDNQLLVLTFWQLPKVLLALALSVSLLALVAIGSAPSMVLLIAATISVGSAVHYLWTIKLSPQWLTTFLQSMLVMAEAINLEKCSKMMTKLGDQLSAITDEQASTADGQNEIRDIIRQIKLVENIADVHKQRYIKLRTLSD